MLRSECMREGLLHLFIASSINVLLGEKESLNVKVGLDSLLEKVRTIMGTYKNVFGRPCANDMINTIEDLCHCIEKSDFKHIVTINPTDSTIQISGDSETYPELMRSIIVESTRRYSTFLIKNINDLAKIHNNLKAAEKTQEAAKDKKNGEIEKKEDEKADEKEESEASSSEVSSSSEEESDEGTKEEEKEAKTDDKKVEDEESDDSDESEDSEDSESDDSDKESKDKGKPDDKEVKKEETKEEEVPQITTRSQRRTRNSKVEPALEITKKDDPKKDVKTVEVEAEEGGKGDEEKEDEEEEEEEEDDEEEEEEEEAEEQQEEAKMQVDEEKVKPEEKDSSSSDTSSEGSSDSSELSESEEEVKTENAAEEAPSRKRRSMSPAITNTNKKFQTIAINLLNTIESHRCSSLFMQPVNKNEVPDYYKVIYEPQDLKNIMKEVKKKTTSPKYTLLKELERDIMLMFANCIMFNNSDEDLVNMARSMRDDTVNTFKLFREAEL